MSPRRFDKREQAVIEIFAQAIAEDVMKELDAEATHAEREHADRPEGEAAKAAKADKR